VKDKEPGVKTRRFLCIINRERISKRLKTNSAESKAKHVVAKIDRIRTKSKQLIRDYENTWTYYSSEKNVGL